MHVALVKRLSSSKGQSRAVLQAHGGGVQSREHPVLEANQGEGLTPDDCGN